MDLRTKAWTGAVVALIVVSALSLAPTQAQESDGRCELSDIQTGVRPGPNDKPVAVTIGFRLIDVTDIDDVGQTIAADFLLSQSWVDPRLTAFEGCQFELSEVWKPQVDVIDSGRLFKRLGERIEVLALPYDRPSEPRAGPSRGLRGQAPHRAKVVHFYAATWPVFTPPLTYLGWPTSSGPVWNLNRA